MIKKLHTLSLKLLGIIIFAFVSMAVITSPLKAQETSEKEQLKSLRSDVGIVGLTGHLGWHNYYTVSDGMDSDIELEVEFRNVRMMSSHVGIGYKFFGGISFVGPFDEIRFGESGIGPMLRYYPFDSKKWQPYLQASSLLGYQLTLGDAPEAVNSGIRFRTSLKAGLTYRVTNSFGIFLEFGPAWDYDSAFSLDTNALRLNIGIELFRFN